MAVLRWYPQNRVPHVTISTLAIFVGLGISLLVDLFWLLNSAFALVIFPRTSPSIAFAFILLFLGQYFLRRKATQHAAYVIILGVIVGTFLSVIEGAFGVNLHVNQLFLVTGFAQAPTFFSLSTAFVLIIISAALLFPSTHIPSREKWSQLFLLAALIVAGMAVLGYVYDAEIFYSSPVGTPMSLTTSVLAMLAVIAALYASRDDGLLKIITNPTSSAIMMRRVLPLLVITPHLCALIVLKAFKTLPIPLEAAAAMVIVVGEIFVIAIFWWNAQKLDQSEIEHKAYARNLAESEARYRTLFEQSSDSILIIDENGRYIDANPQAEKLTGYSREELLSMSVADLTFTEYRSVAEDLYQQLKQDNRAKGEAIFRLKDGRQITVEYTASCIVPGMYQSVLHDITAYKQVEENLRWALEKEHELNEMKSRFVSMVSHEFRTPLSIIRTSSDILERYNYRLSDTQRKEYFANVQTQVTHMVQLLEDVLTVSKSASIGVEFMPEFTELNAFCRQIIDEFQMTSSTHLIIFKSTQEVIAANVDRKLFRQALNNLLSNAVKYSPGKDHINVDLDCQGGSIYLRVQDYGIGIPVEDQGRLFEHFQRARNVGDIFGTGLGLAIVKQAVEAHSGTINFHCAEGTTFTLTLPQPAPDVTPQAN